MKKLSIRPKTNSKPKGTLQVKQKSSKKIRSKYA